VQLQVDGNRVQHLKKMKMKKETVKMRKMKRKTKVEPKMGR
jgi:hypothetical protein